MFKRVVQTTYILLALALLASMTTLALAAPVAQDEDQPDIVEVAQADGRFATLVTALEAAGLVDTLKGEGPFTVFAPTDEAFAALPEGTLDALLADVPALTDVLLYHVVPGQVLAADVVTLESADTVLGQPLSISVDGETVMVNDANVVITDIVASNGVIHVVDAVLLPPSDESAVLEEGAAVEEEAASEEAATEEAAEATVVEADSATICSEDYVIQTDDSLSVIADKFFGSPNAYQGIIDATNVVAATDSRYRPIDSPDLIFAGVTLCIPASAEAAVTVPAAGEEAPAAPEETATAGEMAAASDLPEGKSKLIFENLSSVDLIVDLSGVMFSTSIVLPSETQEIILDPGSYTYNAHQPGGDFSVAPGGFDLTEGQVLGLTCYDSPNCLVRQVEVAPATDETTETVEAAPSAELDIVDTAVADGRFATLATALEAAGLVETLKGEGPFTVFAPTDEAFAALPEGALDELLADTEALTGVLLYHVVPGQVMAAEVVTLESVETVSGQTLPITVDGETVRVGEATVVLTDVEAANGVIHVIDTVLIPPADTTSEATAEEAPAEETASEEETSEETSQ